MSHSSRSGLGALKLSYFSIPKPGSSGAHHAACVLSHKNAAVARYVGFKSGLPPYYGIAAVEEKPQLRRIMSLLLQIPSALRLHVNL